MEKNQDERNFPTLFSMELFETKKNADRKNKNTDIIKELLDKYFIKDMNDWKDVHADLIITDPPFGIEFSGKNGNYHRNVDNVVDGYVEWSVTEYSKKIDQLLEVIKRNLKENGQALIFSGWNNLKDILLKIKDKHGIYNFKITMEK
jgi:DNA modification methylase